MSHTPGPWKVVRHSSGTGFDIESAEQEWSEVKKDGTPYKRATLRNVSVTISPFWGAIGWRADADLIAAAPDLLAACKGARAVLLPLLSVPGFRLYDAGCAATSAVDALTAAIAKAEGGDR